MNERERLSYLEALDIQQWVSRAQTLSMELHAKPSQYLESEICPANQEALQVAHEVKERLTAKQALVGRKPVEQKPVEQKPVEQKPVEHVVDKNIQIPVKNNPSPVAGVTENALHSQASAQTKDVNYCQLHFAEKNHYFIFADVNVENANTKASVQVLQLLFNIRQAMHKSLAINAAVSRSNPEYFRWPMFDARFKGAHIDQSEQAARESAQAFITSSIQQQSIPLLLLLGENASNLILSDESESAKAGNSRYLSNASRFGKVISSVSLQQMLTEPKAKADLWRCLCQYFSEIQKNA